MFRFSPILLSFFMSSTLLLAMEESVEKTASVAFPILDVGVGARAIGIGEAFVALSDDVSSLYWNSAGLAKMKNPEISLSYDKWFADTYYQYLAVSFPHKFGTLAANLMYVNLGKFELRDQYGRLTNDTVRPLNFGGSLGYGFNVSNELAFGFAVKMIHQDLVGNKLTGFAGDLGALYRLGKVSLGFNIQNLGKAKDFTMPINAKFGVGYYLVDTRNTKLRIAGVLKKPVNDSITFGLGSELKFSKSIAIRAGYSFHGLGQNLGTVSGIRGGFGYTWNKLQFDYAIAPYGKLGVTHRASMSLKFGPLPQEEPAASESQSTQQKNPGTLTEESLDSLPSLESLPSLPSLELPDASELPSIEEAEQQDEKGADKVELEPLEDEILVPLPSLPSPEKADESEILSIEKIMEAGQSTLSTKALPPLPDLTPASKKKESDVTETTLPPIEELLKLPPD